MSHITIVSCNKVRRKHNKTYKQHSGHPAVKDVNSQVLPQNQLNKDPWESLAVNYKIIEAGKLQKFGICKKGY